MDRGAWLAAVHGVAKSRRQLSDFTFTFYFHALEKEMATHSSVLAWRIPGKGKPGGLLSMGSHRVGHDWSDLAAGDRKYKTAVWKESQASAPPLWHTYALPFTHSYTVICIYRKISISWSLINNTYLLWLDTTYRMIFSFFWVVNMSFFMYLNSHYVWISRFKLLTLPRLSAFQECFLNIWADLWVLSG